MVNYRILAAFVGLLSVLSFCGCKPNLTLGEDWIAGREDVILAEADGGLALKASDFFSDLSESPLLMNGGVIPKEEARYRLDSVLLDTLAGLSAHDVRLEEHYTSFYTYRIQYYDYLLYNYWDETLYKHITTDSAEVIEFYYENANLFAVDEQVNLYHILVSPYSLTVGEDSVQYSSLSREELVQAAEERINWLVRLLDYGEPFQNVAYNHSHDVSSREQGGYVGWTTREKYLDPFDSVAFSLQVGEYSRPYRDKDGWHLVYVDGYLPSGPVPVDSPGVFQSAWQTVLTSKSNQALAARLDSLHVQINVAPNPLIMGEDVNIHLIPDSVWVGILNGRDTIDARYAKTFEEALRKKYDVRNTTPDMKMEMLRVASERYIQIQAARAAGIDTLPKIVVEEKRLRHLKQKAVVQANGYDFTWEPLVSDIDADYYANRDKYLFDKPMEVQAVVTKDSAFAEFLREQASTGAELSDIAKEHRGTGRTRVNVRDLGYIGPEDLSRDVYRVAEVTRVGDISRVVLTEQGEYWFFKVLDRKESRSVELARGKIRKRMQDEHAREVWLKYRDDLYSKFNVRILANVKEIYLGNYHVRNKTKEL